MTAVLLSLALTALAFAGAFGLLAAGLRAGDRPGDTTLTTVAPDPAGRGISFAVHNPGAHPVLIGACVRRRSLRLWCEGGSFVSVPRRTSTERFLAGRQAVVGLVEPGESQTVLVPLTGAASEPSELVVAIGETDRLRVVHRAIEPPPTRKRPAVAWPRRSPTESSPNASLPRGRPQADGARSAAAQPRVRAR